MTFARPLFSKKRVNQAGAALCADDQSLDELADAVSVLANWRASHAYPLNTFQATLRSRLKGIDEKALVAQRLKRLPSIVSKLRRFHGMQLARMQDIGGLRAVVRGVTQVRELESAYRTARLRHALVGEKDYIAEPKNDGYRGIHLIFRYENSRAPEYNGLHVELQIRSRNQHAWATAVETMGTFLGQALKAGQGDEEWKHFFRVAAAAMAHAEGSPTIPGLEGLSRLDTYVLLAEEEANLRVLEKLKGFAVAANHILTAGGQGSYHLVVLNTDKQEVLITPFARGQLEAASVAYAEVEQRARAGSREEVVLVSAGPLEVLKKAYPNYFLDTSAFIRQVQRYIAISKEKPKN